MFQICAALTDTDTSTGFYSEAIMIYVSHLRTNHVTATHYVNNKPVMSKPHIMSMWKCASLQGCHHN